MELKLVRQIKTTKSTVGDLLVDDKVLCNTLEDVDRGLKQSDTLEHIKEVKQHGRTAIPTGRYEVIITYSNRFKKLLPLLVDVPGFAGIRIHTGNVAEDTEGCILTGTYNKTHKDFVESSKVAFGLLMPKLEEALKQGRVYINVV